MTTPAAAAGRRRLTFVTTNAGKARELAALLPGWDVVQDPRGYTEVQAGTLAEVTAFGARELAAAGVPTPFVLEDSGLFVDALRGFPGVYSRHALETVGCDGLLRLLADVPAPLRTAHFAADLALVRGDGAVEHVTGRCDGSVAAAAAGSGGFGFDPVFLPSLPPGDPWQGRTFAEVPPTVKGALSHRGQAVRALALRLRAGGVQTAKP